MMSRRFDRDRNSGLLLPRGMRGTYMGAPQQALMGYGGSGLTTPQPVFSNVDVLLHLDSDFSDSSSHTRTVSLSNTPTIDTGAPKFGAGNCKFVGASSQTWSYTGTTFNIRTGLWCFETWIKPSDKNNWVLAATPGANSFYLAATSGLPGLVVGDGTINTIASGSFTSAMTNSVWQHIAVSFDGTTYRAFLDGVLKASSTTLLANTNISVVCCGGRPVFSFYYTYEIDDYRATIGEVLYTTDFAPPASAHPDS